MDVFLIREKSSKELLGVFAASDMCTLFWEVDAFCTPYYFQYKRVGRGGLLTTKDEDGAQLGEGWDRDLREAKGWRSFTHSMARGRLKEAV